MRSFYSATMLLEFGVSFRAANSSAEVDSSVLLDKAMQPRRCSSLVKTDPLDDLVKKMSRIGLKPGGRFSSRAQGPKGCPAPFVGEGRRGFLVAEGYK